MEGSLGLRKGAWTEEEDIVLKNYILAHGERKWHQVPSGAGLNRCRKSCRLRWLNYLRTNIKRGEFSVDEVDLIIRLRNLLGNRWSLIAGRLPGRTANDVKNCWHTRLRKKFTSEQTNLKSKGQEKPETTTKIIKPQPRTISQSDLQRLKKNYDTHDKTIRSEDIQPSKLAPPTLSEILEEDDAYVDTWWHNLLMENTDDGYNLWADLEVPTNNVSFDQEHENCVIDNLKLAESMPIDASPTMENKNCATYILKMIQKELEEDDQLSDCNNESLEMDIWDGWDIDNAN